MASNRGKGGRGRGRGLDYFNREEGENLFHQEDDSFFEDKKGAEKTDKIVADTNKNFNLEFEAALNDNDILAESAALLKNVEEPIPKKNARTLADRLNNFRASLRAKEQGYQGLEDVREKEIIDADNALSTGDTTKANGILGRIFKAKDTAKGVDVDQDIQDAADVAAAQLGNRWTAKIGLVFDKIFDIQIALKIDEYRAIRESGGKLNRRQEDNLILWDSLHTREVEKREVREKIGKGKDPNVFEAYTKEELEKLRSEDMAETRQALREAFQKRHKYRELWREGKAAVSRAIERVDAALSLSPETKKKLNEIANFVDNCAKAVALAPAHLVDSLKKSWAKFDPFKKQALARLEARVAALEGQLSDVHEVSGKPREQWQKEADSKRQEKMLTKYKATEAGQAHRATMQQIKKTKIRGEREERTENFTYDPRKSRELGQAGSEREMEDFGEKRKRVNKNKNKKTPRGQQGPH